MRVRALSMHAGYACAHTGTCCRAGWTVPVDPPVRAAIEAHVAAGRLAPRSGPPSPFVAYDPDAPSRAAFAHDATGACVFLEHGDAPRCRVHRDAGEAALPPTCRQFPRIAVVGDGWVDLTLSHFCPTAAALLVDADAPPVIVEAPACADGRTFEGLDTRGHLSPLLRRGVLHSLDSWRVVEAAAVALLATRGGGAAAHVATLARWLRTLETWTPARGPLDAFAAATVEADADVSGGAGGSTAPETTIADWALAWRAVPAARGTPPMPPQAEAVDDARARLAPWDAAVGRYLAAKVVGSWVPWLAGRSTTLARAVEVSWHVLHVEVAHAGAPLDRRALIQAFGRADLLLAHLVEPSTLVRLLEPAVTPRHDRRRF